ncbi:MAG: TatD family hydrolase [Planctomycetota bacterium]
MGTAPFRTRVSEAHDPQAAMKLFDPHIHMYSRTTEDYAAMALARIRAVLEPSFWLGQPRTNVGSYADYFSSLTRFEPGRAADYGISHYCAISMNPKEANDEGLAREVLSILPAYLAHQDCVAVGEVGFDSITKTEEKCILEQFELAKQHDLPVLIHTPHVNKLDGTERTLALVRDAGVPVDRVLIDHNTEETIPVTRESGCWAGHTIYTRTKLTPERAADILDEFGTERMLINSSADWGPSDPLNVPKTVIELERRGWQLERILEVVWNNPIRFFGQSGRIREELV